MTYTEIVGTWEEVLTHASELEGHRVKVTVLDEVEEERPRVSVLEAAGDLIGSLEGGPEDLSSNPKYLEGYGQ